MNRDIVKKMDEFLLANEQNIVNDLILLAKTPSVVSDCEQAAPYGKNCAQALESSRILFEKSGFESKNFERYGLVYEGSGEKSIGIFAHTDVVPAGEGWIYTKPFEPRVLDGMVIGRGVYDNKSGVVLSLYALKMLRALNIKLKSQIVVFLGSNEEAGMDDCIHFVKEQKMPDLSFVPDGNFPVSIGEKGVMRAMLKSGKNFEDIVVFEGGEAFNTVIDKLNVEIKYTNERFDEILKISEGNDAFSATKENDRIKISVKGVSRHAAAPEGAVNAANLFAKTFKNCQTLCASDRKLLCEIESFTEGYYGESMGIDHRDDIFGNLTCSNGICRIEEKKAMLSIDIRFGVSLGIDKLKEKFFDSVESKGWSAKLTHESEGFAIDKNNPFTNILEKVYSDFSENDAKAFCMYGATYARLLKNAFSVGTQADYISPSFVLPKNHGNPHQRDEVICIKALIEAVKIFAVMLIECDKELNKQ